MACHFVNRNNDFSYVFEKLNGEIARQIAENTNPDRVPLKSEEVEKIARKACTYLFSAPRPRLAASNQNSSLTAAGNQVRDFLSKRYKIAPSNGANPDERRLIYKLSPFMEGADRGYAEPISEEDYNAAVSDAFWQIQTIYEEAVWQKLNRNRNMFQARVVLNSSGLRLRNPNEAFFCNGVFNANNGKFEPLKSGEYLVSPLGFPVYRRAL